MAEESESLSEFHKLPEEILEKILCFFWTNYEQDKLRLVCRLWDCTLLRIRQQRHRKLLAAIDDNKLYFRKYDNSKMRISPSPRASHSSCVFKGNICIFGGSSLSNTVYNDLYIFNVTNRKWTKPVTSGFTPAPRECSTLVVYEGNLVLFGGCCQPPRSPFHSHGKFFNDVHFYNFCEKAWCSPSGIGLVKPRERAEHSASVVNNIMVIFGGAHTLNRFDDVWCLNLDTRKWRCPKISGRKPLGRFGQSQITVNSEKILILGGCDLPNTLFNDFWLLDVQTWSWSEVEVRQPMYAAPTLWIHPAIMVGHWVLMFTNKQGPPGISSEASRMTGVPRAHLQMYKLDCSELLTKHYCTWQPTFDCDSSILSICQNSVNVCDDMIFLIGGLESKTDNTIISVTSFLPADN